MKNKKLVASVAAVMLLATGTFAWQSFSQIATNEIIESVDTPGARLHDYFNGTDKDVFVENYAKGDNSPDVYARIRLSEYFEYGKNAGTTEAVSSNITVVRGDIENASTPLMGDPDTWDIYDYEATLDETSGDIRAYRSLELGGASVFMPTFNQNNTDLEPDVRGTYRDDDGNVKEVPYDDYASYEVEDTESGTVVTADNLAGTPATHEAKATREANIMTMGDWVDAGAPIGDYWVFDTTGWAYYAQAITPGEASGLLLDGITIEENPKEEWYYAVDVTAQIATAGDWGDKESADGEGDATGMYEDLTANAQGLLNKVSGLVQVTNMVITDSSGNPLDTSNLQVGSDATLTVGLTMDIANGTGADSDKNVEWTITELANTEVVARASSNGSGLTQEKLNATVTVTKDGITFEPVEEMVGYYYEIKATSTLAAAEEVSMRVYVYDPSSTIEVSVEGDISDLKAGNSVQVNAYYAGSSSLAPVTWAVTETTGNSGLDAAGLKATISDSGVFTPVVAMAGGTYTVTATTTGSPALSDSVVINVYTTSSGGSGGSGGDNGGDNDTDNGDGSIGDGTGGENSTVTVTVSSTENTLSIGSSLTLSATVTGLSNDSVTWVIAKKSGTSSLTAEEVSATISENGTFTPVSGMSGCTYTIKAISTVDGAFWASKDISVNTASLTISGGATTINKGTSSAAFTATGTNLANTVTWSISSTGHNAGTTINSSTGVLTVAGVETSARTITVKATSTVDTSISQTKDITVTTPTLEVKSAGNATTVDQGDTLQFSVDIENLPEDTVTWSITTTGHNSGTTISTGGLLTIASAETVNRSITVKATSTVDTNLSNTKSIVVTSAGLMGVLDKTEAEITAMVGKDTTITVGGVEFYVLEVGSKATYASSAGGTATTKNAAFLWAKEPWKTTAYTFNTSRSDGYDNSTWAGSDLQATLEAQIKTNATLLELAEFVDTTVAPYTSSQTTISTYDRFFPLSEAEFTGKSLSGTTRAKDSAGSIGDNSITRWLRSPSDATHVRGVGTTTGTLSSVVDAANSRGVRPALWVAL